MSDSKYQHLLEQATKFKRTEMSVPTELRAALDELLPGQHLIMHGDDGRAMVLMDAEDFEHLLALKGIEAQDLSA